MIDFVAIKKALKLERMQAAKSAAKWQSEGLEKLKEAKECKAKFAKYRAQMRSCDLALKAFGEKQDEIEAREES